MRVLVACEFSGVVRDAFLACGHDAWSCDVLPSERPGPHLPGDVRQYLKDGWDLMVAFPPCTYLCRSGARWWTGREDLQAQALGFVLQLAGAPIERVAIENPVGRLSTLWREPDQVVQPYQFGHGEVKRTCLWLRGLPRLQPTRVMCGRTPRVHFAAPGAERWRERSRTLPGIASAMALQWGETPLSQIHAAVQLALAFDQV
jgi:hypothetical protein